FPLAQMLARNPPHMFQPIGKGNDAVKLFGVLAFGVFGVVDVLFAPLGIAARNEEVRISVFTYCYINPSWGNDERFYPFPDFLVFYGFPFFVFISKPFSVSSSVEHFF